MSKQTLIRGEQEFMWTFGPEEIHKETFKAGWSAGSVFDITNLGPNSIRFDNGYIKVELLRGQSMTIQRDSLEVYGDKGETSTGKVVVRNFSS